MKKWIFAIYSNFDGINTLFTIDAKDKTDIEAVGEALLQMCTTQEGRDSHLSWWKEEAFDDLEELGNQLMNQDLSLSKLIMAVL